MTAHQHQVIERIARNEELQRYLCSESERITLEDKNTQNGVMYSFPKALMRIYYSQGQAVSFLKYALTQTCSSSAAEIQSGTDLLTRMWSQFCHLAGKDIVDAIAPTLQLFIARPKNLEIDPDRLQYHNKLKTKRLEDILHRHQRNLRGVTKRFLNTICSTHALFSTPLKQLLQHLYKTVHLTSPGNEYKIIGDYLFPRFIFRVILSPELFGLSATLSPLISRALLLISKLLYHVVSGSTIRSAYMAPLSDFVTRHIPVVRAFIDRILISHHLRDTTPTNFSEADLWSDAVVVHNYLQDRVAGEKACGINVARRIIKKIGFDEANGDQKIQDEGQEFKIVSDPRRRERSATLGGTPLRCSAPIVTRKISADQLNPPMRLRNPKPESVVCGSDKVDPTKWSVAQVGCWLTEIGFRTYREAFARNGIDGERLAALDEMELAFFVKKKDAARLAKSCKELFQRHRQVQRSSSLPSPVVRVSLWRSAGITEWIESVGKVMLKDPKTWTTFDVADWLELIGYEKYSEAFVNQAMNGQQLLKLVNSSQLKVLGVQNAERKILLSKIKELRCNHARLCNTIGRKF